jgi:hypothetical protein
MTLLRLVLDYRGDVLLVRALYEKADPALPGPNTKARTREVTEITRSGLRSALATLEGDTQMVGSSGFTRREDILSVALPRPDEPRELAS